MLEYRPFGPKYAKKLCIVATVSIFVRKMQSRHRKLLFYGVDILEGTNRHLLTTHPWIVDILPD